ncbi:MAG: metalloregulator ArsR/SmtB family transcription factor [Candidatus Saliniplasma sp.]
MEIPDEIEEELTERGGLGNLIDKIDEDSISEQSRIYNALSDEIRLKILTLLNEQSLCVCLMKKILDIADSKLSYHLSILKDVGLIEGARRANFVIYEITDKGRRYLK